MKFEPIELLDGRVKPARPAAFRLFRRRAVDRYNPVRMRTTAMALLVMAGGLVAASALAAESWLGRAAGAPMAIVAQCQSRTSRWEGGSVYSYSDVSVLEIVRGAPELTLVVRQRGGEVDGVGQKVSHVSLLEPGRRYLLFLAPDLSGNWSPTAKGVNPIVPLADGTDGVGGEPLDRVIAELGGGD
jgi:hypothetical protein